MPFRLTMRVPRKLALDVMNAALPQCKADVKVFFVEGEILPNSEKISDESCSQLKALIQAELPILRPTICSNKACTLV